MNLPSPSQLLGSGQYDSWYPGQEDLLTQSLDWYDSPARFLGMSIPTGCHAKGQHILMHNGTVSKVEDVKVGDRLLGMDGQPRLVLKLIRGSGRLYDVIPVKGDSFRVNEDHLLTLVCTGTRRFDSGRNVNNGSHGGLVDGEIRDVTVKDVLAFSSTRKHISKLIRVPVDFPYNDYALPISPYVLGVLLGDGSLGGLTDNGGKIGLVVSVGGKIGTDAKTYRLSMPSGKGWRVKGSVNRNMLFIVLDSMGLLGACSGDKFIPQCYKVSSRNDRLELLAGLIDTDGHGGQGKRKGYDFVSKSEDLAKDFAFICRSVGLAAYVKPCVKGIGDSFAGLYYRVTVSGDCSIIPSRYKAVGKRQQKKSVLHTGFTLAYAGIGDYYGFALDGDGRYLLDDFTVTHNSGKSLSSLLLSKLSETRTVVLTATKGLQKQYQSMAEGVGGTVVVGQNNFPCILVNGRLTADEGPCHDGIPCAVREQCPYRIQLRKALESDLVITNYAYWLAQTNFSSGLGEFGLMVCDEGHQCFSSMENYLTIFISRLDLQPIGISFPESPDQWNVWQSWAEVSVPIAADTVNRIDMEMKNYRSRNEIVPSHLSRTYRTANSIHARLKRLSSVGEQWVIQKTYHGYRFVPKWVSNYSNHLFHDIPKVVLMSAILSHRSADYLGVPSNGSRAWIEMDSHFPPSKAPMWHIPTARINYRTDDYGSTIWCSRIDQIIQRRLDRKGIVFTVSYERAKMLLSRSRFKDIMVTHSTGDVVQVVEKFKRMPAPAVLVSPSVTTGWDFPMMESGHGKPQYAIVGKVPYPDTKDLVTQARHTDDKTWTSYLAMEVLVQECGRLNRSAVDESETFFIDDNITWFFRLYGKFAPKYFMSRWRGSLASVPDALL